MRKVYWLSVVAIQFLIHTHALKPHLTWETLETLTRKEPGCVQGMTTYEGDLIEAQGGATGPLNRLMRIKHYVAVDEDVMLEMPNGVQVVGVTKHRGAVYVMTHAIGDRDASYNTQLYPYVYDTLQRKWRSMPHVTLTTETDENLHHGTGVASQGSSLITTDETAVIRFHALHADTLALTTGQLISTYQGYQSGNFTDIDFIPPAAFDNGKSPAMILAISEGDELNIHKTKDRLEKEARAGPNHLLLIDATEGTVMGQVDLEKFAPPPDAQWITPAEDLNCGMPHLSGVAYDYHTNRLFVSGRQWRARYEIRIMAPGGYWIGGGFGSAVTLEPLCERANKGDNSSAPVVVEEIPDDAFGGDKHMIRKARRKAAKAAAAAAKKQGSGKYMEPCKTLAHAFVKGIGANGREISGLVLFHISHGGVHVKANITGLDIGAHGVAIHEGAADFDPANVHSCEAIGDHFDPLGSNRHGAPTDVIPHHLGDLGNLLAAPPLGLVRWDAVYPDLRLNGNFSIIGRTLGIAPLEDDGGHGRNELSEVNGNAGLPIACAIIRAGKWHPPTPVPTAPPTAFPTPPPTPVATAAPTRRPTKAPTPRPTQHTHRPTAAPPTARPTTPPPTPRPTAPPPPPPPPPPLARVKPAESTQKEGKWRGESEQREEREEREKRPAEEGQSAAAHQTDRDRANGRSQPSQSPMEGRDGIEYANVGYDTGFGIAFTYVAFGLMLYCVAFAICWCWVWDDEKEPQKEV